MLLVAVAYSAELTDMPDRDGTYDHKIVGSRQVELQMLQSQADKLDCACALHVAATNVNCSSVLPNRHCSGHVRVRVESLLSCLTPDAQLRKGRVAVWEVWKCSGYLLQA